MIENMSKGEEIVRRIMQKPIPENGNLSHPLKNGKSAIKQITFNEVKSYDFPVDINLWQSKTFVDYFAKRFNDETGGNYRKVYKSDNAIIRDIGNFFSSNGLNRNSYTKKIIDWCFKRRIEITNREQHFTLQEILKQINYFYQQEILPKVEEGSIERDTEDTFLLEELQNAISDGKTAEVFYKFGIPVGITYLVKIKGIKFESVIKVIEDKIKKLSSGSVIDKQKLERMLQASIVGSPYPCDFLALDWRKIYAEYLKGYKKEIWWREEDYGGKPLSKYNHLL